MLCCYLRWTRQSLHLSCSGTWFHFVPYFINRIYHQPNYVYIEPHCRFVCESCYSHFQMALTLSEPDVTLMRLIFCNTLNYLRCELCHVYMRQGLIVRHRSNRLWELCGNVTLYARSAVQRETTALCWHTWTDRYSDQYSYLFVVFCVTL